MKKIIIATTGLSSTGQTGGISAYVHDLGTNLIEAGYNVWIYLIKEKNTKEPISVKYKYKLYDIPGNYEGEENIIKELLNDINEIEPDIIINNGTSYMAGLWPVLKFEIIKISVVHAFSKTLGLNISGIMGKIATVNHGYIDYIVCQNSKMVRDLSEKYEIPQDKVVFIPQSYRTDTSKLNNNNTDKLKIIFANGNSKNKGAEVMKKIALLLAKSQIKYNLKWIKLNNLPSFLQSENTITYPSLTRNEFIEHLKLSDIIIIPTKLDTGPMLVVEAMAYGVVPICNNLENSAIPDLVQNRKNGVLIDNNSPKNFFEEISKLYYDRKLLLELKDNARTYYLNNLTEKNQVKHYAKLFHKRSAARPTNFNNKNIIYNHHKQTSHLPIYSFKRIYLKLRYTFEKPIYKKS